jgi:hypothetical protein
MRRTLAVMLLVTAVAVAVDTHRPHRDYVPDPKTAELIADAVLVAQYGEERMNGQRPLMVDGSNKDYWIVQGSPRENGMPKIGGGPAVWINKHSGCLSVMEHMK